MALCKCGCGKDAGRFTKTRLSRNQRKGDDRTFISGHNSRLLTPEEQQRRGRLNDGSKLRYSGEGKTYVKYRQGHLHIFLAEQKIGRKLLPEEVVHHIDGNPRNNDEDNLEVLPNQSMHYYIHTMERWYGKDRSKWGASDE